MFVNIALIMSSDRDHRGVGTVRVPPLGLGYIASVVREETESKVKIFDFNVQNVKLRDVIEWGGPLWYLHKFFAGK